MGCKQSSERQDPPPQQQKQEFSDIRPAERNDSRAASPPQPVDDVKTSANRPQSKYKCGGPTMQGELFECFKGGLLYRITNGENWGFYNDTTDFEMHVNWKFGPESKLKAMGDTHLSVDENNWFAATLVIYPGETKPFVSGTYNGYKSSLSAQPLSEAFRAKMTAESQRFIERQIADVRAVAGSHKDQEKILEACLLQNVPYVDLDFIPGQTSLSRKGIDDREITGIAWKRPTQFLPPNLHASITTFNETISPDDVDQGALGDCWFLCAVASLTEMPEKVKDIFRHPVSSDVARRERAVGAYRVTFNKNGWWYNVIVDDYLPVVGNTPVFARCQEDACELWVSLIEKAYAKIHGSYASITGGDALLALQDLTGYPTCRFDTEWNDAKGAEDKKLHLFDQILRYDGLGYLINVNTPGVDNSAYMGAHGASNSKEFEEEYGKLGLAMGHAYSVIRAVKVGNTRLLQIRNPWGNEKEWTGAWGDHSPLWEKHPDIKAACGFTGPKADGSFWMAFDDVLRYFDGGGACFTRTNWFDYRIQTAFQGGYPNVALRIKVTAKATVMFMVSQKDKRGAAPGSADDKYAAMMLSFCAPNAAQPGKYKVEWNSTTDADAPSTKYTFNYSRDLSMQLDLEPKEDFYYLVPRIYEAGASKDIVLGLISSVAVGKGIEVEFVKLPQTCRLFQNFQSFDAEGATPVSVPFQFNPEVGCAKTSQGTRLQSIA